MKVLIVGSNDKHCCMRVVKDKLTELYVQGKIDNIIVGRVNGYSGVAMRWAQLYGVPVDRYRLDDSPSRQEHYEEIIRRGKPDLVLAWPGGQVTRDMLSLCEAQGIPIEQVPPW